MAGAIRSMAPRAAARGAGGGGAPAPGGCAPALAPPAFAAGLEELAVAADACAPAALACALLHAVARWLEAEAAAAQPGRPARACLLAAPRRWLAERGLPRPEPLAGAGLAPARLLVAVAADEAQALWAVEEALRSGAVGLALAAVARPGFTATLRLDHAARAAEARAALLRVGEAADLSAARVRWRIAPAPSARNPRDARAPGGPAWVAQARRRRDGPPGAWRMEWDDAAHAVRVAGRLADDGLAAGTPAGRRGLAAAA
jgi:protein ImuA